MQHSYTTNAMYGISIKTFYPFWNHAVAAVNRSKAVERSDDISWHYSWQTFFEPHLIRFHAWPREFHCTRFDDALC